MTYIIACSKGTITLGKEEFYKKLKKVSRDYEKDCAKLAKKGSVSIGCYKFYIYNRRIFTKWK